MFQSNITLTVYGNTRTQKINAWTDEFRQAWHSLNDTLIHISNVLCSGVLLDKRCQNVLTKAAYDALDKYVADASSLAMYSRAVANLTYSDMSIGVVDRLLGRDDRLRYWSDRNCALVNYIDEFWDRLYPLVDGKVGKFLTADRVEEIRLAHTLITEAIDYSEVYEHE